MTQTTPRVPWGTGRVAVRANLEAIYSVLLSGLPLTHAYCALALDISYPAFARAVGQSLGSPRAIRRAVYSDSDPLAYAAPEFRARLAPLVGNCELQMMYQAKLGL